MKADAEIIATAIEIMKSFNLTKKDFYIRISNRKIIQSYLKNLGITKIQDVSRLIDKREKLSQEDFNSSLKEIGINKEQINKVNYIFRISKIDEVKKYINDLSGNQGIEELESLFKYLNQYGLSSFCKLDLSIIRGFDYYTSTVFEVFDSTNEFRAIAGGGRYDDLAGIPGVGYAMGDVVLELLLEKKGKLKSLGDKPDIYIIYTEEKTMKKALFLTSKLRLLKNVELDVMNKNFSKQIKYANDIKSDYLIVIGPDEIKSKKYKLKNMKTGKSGTYSEESLLKFFSKN